MMGSLKNNFFGKFKKTKKNAQKNAMRGAKKKFLDNLG